MIGGLAGSEAVLIGARLVQGVGAAMMLPAALSILTTSFKEGKDRNTAIGVWGGVGGLASAAGVLLGGLLTEGPGWRWVMFVNPIAAVFVLAGIFALISGERHCAQLRNFDLLGAILVTGGMLLLVYAREGVHHRVGQRSHDRRARRRAGAPGGVRDQRAIRSRRCRSSVSTGSGSPTSPS